MHVTVKNGGMHVSDNDAWRSAQEAPAGSANDLIRRTREQAGAVAEPLYQHGTRASECMTENAKAYPITALFTAGVIGYATAYLVHAPSGAHKLERRYRSQFGYDPGKMRRDRVPHRGEVIGRDVPDESKERHTEIAVEAGRITGETNYRR